MTSTPAPAPSPSANSPVPTPSPYTPAYNRAVMDKAIWIAILAVLSLIIGFGAGALMVVLGATAATALCVGGAAFATVLTLFILVLNTLWTS